MAPWDLLVRGGTLIDPAQSIKAKRDVAFSGGRVAAVAETLTGEAFETIDASGALVTPGLIDIHAHVYADSPRPTPTTCRLLSSRARPAWDRGDRGVADTGAVPRRACPRRIDPA